MQGQHHLNPSKLDYCILVVLKGSNTQQQKKKEEKPKQLSGQVDE
jgi:hypothetical protein